VEGAPRENNFLQRRPALQGWETGGGEGGEGVEWREEDPRHDFRRNRVITRNVRSERAFRRPERSAIDRRSIVSRDPSGLLEIWGKYGYPVVRTRLNEARSRTSISREIISASNRMNVPGSRSRESRIFR